VEPAFFEEPLGMSRKPHANGNVSITGRVVSGARKAAEFTRLGWVEAQCFEKLGFNPYPGTLNIQLLPESASAFNALEKNASCELIPPDPSFCTAKIIPICLESLEAALVIPSEDVRTHGKDVLEVIAPVCIRKTLGLGDGDEVTLVVGPPTTPCLFIQGTAEDQRLPLRGLIFDLDGTLLDTREIFFTILDVVFERLRFPGVPRETLVEAAAEGVFDWEVVLPDTARAKIDEILPRIRAIVEEVSPPIFLERTAMVKGAEELLKRLSSAGIKLGVVTSTKRRHLVLKLGPIRESGLEGVFHAMIAADDIPRRKPAPDPLLECARRLGVVPAQCAYVGDMRVDIRSGKSAGMLTIGVLTGFDTRSTLMGEGADLILDSVASLQDKLELSFTCP
jgi:HAD superfamily hydrolase (TIGR01509 family)